MKASVFARPEERKINQNLKMNQTKLNRKTTAASGRGDFAALLGLDWASQRHALCLYDCATPKERKFHAGAHPRSHCAVGPRPRATFRGKENRPLSGTGQRSAHLCAPWSIPSLSSIRSTPPQPRVTVRPLK